MFSRSLSLAFVAILTAPLFFGGCGDPEATQKRTPPSATNSPASSVAVLGSKEERRAQLLRQIRASDPRKETIERALINDNDELGIIINHRASLDDIPRLVKAILPQMAQLFPNEDLTVVAYTPTEPPRRLGVGHFSTRTRDMTYRPETP